MKIAICGSMNFAQEMMEAKAYLEKKGHSCAIPEFTDKYASGSMQTVGGSEGAHHKISHDLINEHYRKIKKADAILVLNKDKNGIANYIGGNSFLEIGFAYVLKKKIFLFNDIPEMEMMREELEAMQPTILHGDLSLVH